MSNSWRPPACGDVEIIYGLMGSGKSYLAVMEVLRIIQEERRPVYTNLPLRWRVVKQWLRNRGGSKLAGLLFPLTETHFRAFVDRQHSKLRFRDAMRADAQRERRQLSEPAFEAAWLEKHGPDVTTGPDANWIDPLAVLVVDEAHHWYSQQEQREEGKKLQDYLTMLRHHLHRFILVTQDPMQVNIAFRRLASYFTEVKAQGEEQLAWGIRFKHVGIRAIHFERMTKEAYEDPRVRAKMPPVRTGLVFAGMRYRRWVFRLYDSFTHQGGVRRLRRRLVEVRKSQGLNEAGKDEDEVIIKRVYRWRPAVFTMLIGFVLGVGLGARQWTKQAAEIAAAAPEVVPLSGRLSGVMKGVCVVDGAMVRVGERRGDYELLVCEPERRGSVWSSEWRVYVWTVGEEPELVGDPRELVTAYRSFRLGGGVRRGSQDSGSAVGAPVDNDLGGGPDPDSDGGGAGG